MEVLCLQPAVFSSFSLTSSVLGEGRRDGYEGGEGCPGWGQPWFVLVSLRLAVN